MNLLIGTAIVLWGWKRGKRKVWWYIIGGFWMFGALIAFAPPSAPTAAPPQHHVHHKLTAAQKQATAAKAQAAKRRAFLSWWGPLAKDITKADNYYQPIRSDIKASAAGTMDPVTFYQDAQNAANNLLTVDPSSVSVPSGDAYVQQDAEGYVSAEWAIANEMPADINDNFTVAQLAQLKTDIQNLQDLQIQTVVDALKASSGTGISAGDLFPSR